MRISKRFYAVFRRCSICGSLGCKDADHTSGEDEGRMHISERRYAVFRGCSICGSLGCRDADHTSGEDEGKMHISKRPYAVFRRCSICESLGCRDADHTSEEDDKQCLPLACLRNPLLGLNLMKRRRSKWFVLQTIIAQEGVK